MAFFSDLLNPDKLKKKAISTVKKTSTYIAEDAKKKEAKKAADFKALTSSVKSGAKTVYEAYKPVYVPSTPLPKVEAEKLAAQVKIQSEAKKKVETFGKTLSLLNQTPEMQAVIQRNKLTDLQNQFITSPFSAPKKQVPLPYIQAAKNPEFRGQVASINTPQTIGKLTDFQKKQMVERDKREAQEAATQIAQEKLTKDKFINKKLQGLQYAQSLTGSGKVTPLPELKKQNSALVKQYSDMYDKRKRVASFASKAGDVFVKDLKRFIGDKKYEELEVTEAWNPARVVPKMMSAAAFDVVDFEDLLQTGKNLKVRDGQLWLNGEPVGEEFTTEKGKKSAQKADIAAALLGSAPTYVGLSKGLTKLITKGAVSKIPSVQKFFGGVQQVQARYPILSEIALINPTEEVAEAGIRKGTGQQYSFSDFVSGLGIGAVMGGAVSIAGKQFKAEEIEKVLDKAEKVAAKTGDINQVMAIPFGGTNLGTLYKENRFAFNKQVIPGQRPGIEVAAPLPRKQTPNYENLPEETDFKDFQNVSEPYREFSKILKGESSLIKDKLKDIKLTKLKWGQPPSTSTLSKVAKISITPNSDLVVGKKSGGGYILDGTEVNGERVLGLDTRERGSFETIKELEDYLKSRRWVSLSVPEYQKIPLSEGVNAVKKDLEKIGVERGKVQDDELKSEISELWEINQLTPKGFLRANNSWTRAAYELKNEKLESLVKKVISSPPKNINIGIKDDVIYFDVDNQQVSFHVKDPQRYRDLGVPEYAKEWIGVRQFSNPIKSTNLPKTPLKTDDFAFLRGHKKTPRAGIDAPAPLPKLDGKAEVMPSIESVKKKLPQYPYITQSVDTPKGAKQLFELKKKEKVYDKEVSKIVLPVEQALGIKQGQEYRVKTKLAIVAKKFKDRGISAKDEKDIESIFNRIEQKDKYGIPESLRKKGVDDSLIDELRSLQKFLTKEQTDRNLLEKTIDPESYIKTQLVQFDGSPLTKRQVAQLQVDLSKDFWKKLGKIQSKGGGGTGKFSVKKGGDIERKYNNADERDAVLAKFGVKTNRNIFEVLASQANDVATKTASVDFVKSLRESARSGASEVVEVFDPQAIKDFRLELKADLKLKRDEILDRMRKNKTISETQYRDAIAKTKDIFGKIKADIRGDIDAPKDIQKQIIDEFDQEFALIKSEVSDLMGENKGISNFATKKEIDALKVKYQKRLDSEFQNIVNKELQVPDDYVSISMGANPALAQALRGLRFTKQQAKAIEKVFKKLDPNSAEDLVMGLKAAVATGDLFQMAEVARQSFATQGFKGLNFKKIMQYDPEEFLDRATEATKYGVLVGKPTDIATDFSNNLGRIVDDLDKSFVARNFDKLLEKSEKIPGFSTLKEGVTEGFAKLERLQWETTVPRFKVATFEQSWPQFKKIYPQLSDLEAKTMAADFVNNTFQGINWDKVMSRDTIFGRNLNKSIMRASRLLLFGPDRFGSVLFRYAKSFGPYGAPYRRFAMRSMAAGVVMLQMLNYAFTGHSTLENTKGSEFELEIPQITDEKGNPMAMNVMGTWTDPFKFAWSPAKFVKNKKSLLLGTVSSLQGGPFAPETIREAIWENAPIPITIKGMFDPLVEPLLGKKETAGPKTGQTDFKTSVLGSALDFSGLPTTFRSGQAKQATLKDMVTGKASFWEYATSKELTGSKNVNKKKVDKIVKKAESPAELKEALKKELLQMKENGASEDEMEKFAKSALEMVEEKQSIEKLKNDSTPLKDFTPKEIKVKKAKDIKKIANKFKDGNKDEAKEMLKATIKDLTPEQQEAIAEAVIKEAGL